MEKVKKQQLPIKSPKIQEKLSKALKENLLRRREIKNNNSNIKE